MMKSRAIKVVRLVLSIYVVGWLAATPASRLGGVWWACGLMVCACVWLFDAVDALRRR